jgi:hypothetical protein
MSQASIKSQKNPSQSGISGLRLATVVGHGDNNYMGTLFVSLKGIKNDNFGSSTQQIPAYYCPPFFGATNFAFNGKNTGNDSAFNDTQKSYGMCFVPPDVGVTVLVGFVQETGQCFWLGCVPDINTNYMVPAIGLSKAVDASSKLRSDYGSDLPLPVAEYNKNLPDAENNRVKDNIKRPVHPIAGFMLAQGLIRDYVRGPVTSSMRRNYISNVYGILTPGPLDKRPNATKKPLGNNDKKSEPVPVSRVGGTQFVMDDGDDRFVRKKPAGEGPPEYVPAGQGDSRVPISEYFRVRTRTGHQILLHNTEDLIYIGNSRGTAWIELTSNGKIDIFAGDSVSIHSEGDFNFRADRDINLEAGRNINIRSEKSTYQESGEDFSLIVEKNSKIHYKGTLDQINVQDMTMSYQGNYALKVTGDYKVIATGDTHMKGKNTFIQSTIDTNILTGVNHKETAAKIYMNSSTSAEPASVTVTDPSEPTKLDLRDNDVVDVTQAWSSSGYQSTTPLKSIMKRIPMHEPWYGHENTDPEKAGLKSTDRDV